MTAVKNKVYNIISETLKVDSNVIDDSMGPGDIEQWDSLGQIQLMSQIEKSFNVKFDVDQIMSINTVSDIVLILSNDN